MNPAPAINRMLIADDDDSVRWTLREIFEPVGFEVYLATNGEETLELLDDHAVDCLLMDMHMPGLTGLETFQLVRQRDSAPPCILLTADTSQELLQRALALHVFTVLSKPVSKSLVTSTVKRAIRSGLRAS